jgi:pantoate--beta-alanine ligase
MIKYKSAYRLNKYIQKQKKLGKTVGFIPTMGALHQGHLSLIQAAKNECDIAVCSVFVNPTQFNKASDLEKYPRNLDADAILLESVACDVLFNPSVKTIYPDGADRFDAPKVGDMLDVLEGEHRPGHFQGVMQVISLLLDIIDPTQLYMGLKDFQQFAICSKMVEMQGRAVEMRGMPIVREANGLAMSSRNERVSAAAKNSAGIIYESLQLVKDNLDNYSIIELKNMAKKHIASLKGGELEYFEIVSQKTLRVPEEKVELIALCAVWLEGIRLIDNIIL